MEVSLHVYLQLSWCVSTCQDCAPTTFTDHTLAQRHRRIPQNQPPVSGLCISRPTHLSLPPPRHNTVLSLSPTSSWCSSRPWWRSRPTSLPLPRWQRFRCSSSPPSTRAASSPRRLHPSPPPQVIRGRDVWPPPCRSCLHFGPKSTKFSLCIFR